MDGIGKHQIEPETRLPANGGRNGFASEVFRVQDGSINFQEICNTEMSVMPNGRGVVQQTRMWIGRDGEGRDDRKKVGGKCTVKTVQDLKGRYRLDYVPLLASKRAICCPRRTQLRRPTGFVVEVQCVEYGIGKAEEEE